MNRVSDYIFIVGLCVIFWVFGSLEFNSVFILVPYIDQGVVTIICVCLLIAAMGKSAQIGLHGWLRRN